MNVTASIFIYMPFLPAAIVLCAVVSIIYMGLKNGITPMASSRSASEIIAREAGKIIKEGTVVEAGAGWGFPALKLAQELPGCTVIGLENSPVPYFFCRLLRAVTRRQNLLFLRDDIYFFDYSDVDIIVCYLYPRGMEKLKDTLSGFPGKKRHVISNTFAFSGREPLHVLRAADLYRSPVYLYYF